MKIKVKLVSDISFTGILAQEFWLLSHPALSNANFTLFLEKRVEIRVTFPFLEVKVKSVPDISFTADAFAFLLQSRSSLLNANFTLFLRKDLKLELLSLFSEVKSESEID